MKMADAEEHQAVADGVQKNLIVLLSCVKSKRNHLCKAADMYTSPLFQQMMAYARSLKPKSVCKIRPAQSPRYD